MYKSYINLMSLNLEHVSVAGLKLGMFAAIGGGIMGYTTGKMFKEHE